MIVPGHLLRHRVAIEPYSERQTIEILLHDTLHHPGAAPVRLSYGESHAGYDLRLDKLSRVPLPTGQGKAEPRKEITLYPGDFVLGSVIEHIRMPNDLVGIVHDKSTLARLGLAVQNTVIEPGWEGYLTVEISNHGPDILTLRHGMPICQVLFHVLECPARPYDGKYQGQPPMPVGAR